MNQSKAWFSVIGLVAAVVVAACGGSSPQSNNPANETGQLTIWLMNGSAPPSGLLRRGRRPGSDEHRRPAHSGPEADGGPQLRPELLRALLPRQVLVCRAAVRLGLRRRHRHPVWRQVAGLAQLGELPARPE